MAASLGVTAGTGTRFFAASTGAAAKKQGDRRTMFFVRRDVVLPAGSLPGTKPTNVYTKTASYLGQWAADAREGFGLQSYPDGSRYEGQWRANKPHGRGKLEAPDATPGAPRDRHTGRARLVKVYEGDYEAGLRHGHGTLLLPDGGSYEGGFVRGVREGQGREVSGADGSVYTGSFVGGLRHGRGSLAMRNGDRYEGSFEHGEKHGAGTLVYASRRMVLEGEWVRGQARCGEMRQILGDDDPAAHAAAPVATEPGVESRGAFPTLELLEPHGVLRHAAQEAHRASAAAALAAAAAAGGHGHNSGNGSDFASAEEEEAGAAAAAAEEEDAAEASSLLAHLSLAGDELRQLAAAFRAGEATARALGLAVEQDEYGGAGAGALGAALLPAHGEVLAQVLMGLGISASAGDIDGLRANLVRAQAAHDGAMGPAGAGDGAGISFFVFASVMAALRA